VRLEPCSMARSVFKRRERHGIFGCVSKKLCTYVERALYMCRALIDKCVCHVCASVSERRELHVRMRVKRALYICAKNPIYVWKEPNIYVENALVDRCVCVCAMCAHLCVHVCVCAQHHLTLRIQGDEDPLDPLSLWVIFRKRAL